MGVVSTPTIPLADTIFINMTKEQVFGIIRHTLTFVGGLMVVKGTIDESTLEQIISGVITLTGLVWSVVDKNNK
jgi:hypothetical protein